MASAVGCTLSIVNLSVVVSPGMMGLLRNSLVKVKPATSRSSLAVADVTIEPPTVADTMLVVFVKLPAAAPTGASSVTLKVQESPGSVSVPSMSVKRVSPAVPTRVLPTLQGGVRGGWQIRRQAGQRHGQVIGKGDVGRGTGEVEAVSQRKLERRRAARLHGVVGERLLQARRRQHRRWKIYGIALPDEILAKVYRENAARVLGLA